MGAKLSLSLLFILCIVLGLIRSGDTISERVGGHSVAQIDFERVSILVRSPTQDR